MSVIAWILTAKVACEVSGRALIVSGVLDLGTPIRQCYDGGLMIAKK